MFGVWRARSQRTVLFVPAKRAPGIGARTGAADAPVSADTRSGRKGARSVIDDGEGRLYQRTVSGGG